MSDEHFMSESENEHATSNQMQPAPVESECVSESCWLCLYSHSTDAKMFSQFVVDNVGCASMISIAQQISEDLQERHPDAEGTSINNILQHIESHSLHPVCKMAVMLRSLLRLTEDLQHNMRKHDEDGNLIMDPKLIEMFLKTQTQIMSIYKTVETNRLLFSEKSI
jgi:hypothetical protein